MFTPTIHQAPSTLMALHRDSPELLDHQGIAGVDRQRISTLTSRFSEPSQRLARTSPSPEDTNVDLVDPKIRWIHFVLGCTVLVPWNVLITAMPFFLSRLAGSPVHGTFSSYLSITYIISEFVFLAHATAISKSVSHARQTRITTTVLLFLTLLLTTSTFIHSTPRAFFRFVLLIALVEAAMGSYLQSSVIAVASLFGPVAVQAVMSGQAAVAVAVSAVQLLSAVISLSGAHATPRVSGKIIGPAAGVDLVRPEKRTPEALSAFAFFAFSTLFLGGSVLAQSWLVRMPAYEILVAPVERKNLQVKDVGGVGERRALLASAQTTFEEETTKERILRVAKSNVTYEVAVAYVFVITLSVFPAITTAIMPTNPRFHPLVFSAVHFLIFNLGDLFGRYLCSFPRLLIWSSCRLLALSLARTLFIPLFLLCNIRLPSSGSAGPPPIVNSDIAFFLILFAFGASNGYVSSLCLMAAPSLEHNEGLKGKEDVDTAATIGVFCLVGGLAVGSVGSFGIRAVICGCNPFVS